MFPTKFINDAKVSIRVHNAICFFTSLDNETVTKRLREEGIAKFITLDVGKLGVRADTSSYQDKRIDGLPNIHVFVECCGFTKDPNQWYLFPFHKKELEAVGLVEDDLIEWIKFLNDTRAGFKYLYFGEQESIPQTNESGVYSWNRIGYRDRMDSNTFYWIGVAPFPKNTNINVPYLHWICLRYLINSLTSSNYKTELSAGTRLAYYNIPRIALMLNKEYNVPKFKAFLYAHIAHPFCCSKSLAYSDYMGIWPVGDSSRSTPEQKKQYCMNIAAPCVNITALQFRKLWNMGSHSGSMNPLLTQKTYEYKSIVREIPGLKGLEAPYDPNLLYKLFNEGNYEGFIKHIESSYKKLKISKNGKKETSTVGKHS